MKTRCVSIFQLCFLFIVEPQKHKLSCHQQRT
nr:MAG TPA: hypothetical protein [Caudoviricetes sp.]DAH84178.1 MAG TPA: hypothetical protein [Caudoviricetes sp.]DAI50989.1 MAG TPA: hypothetical protein [Caudoviricetes sp.]DAK10257.1 MAG TPA: hypothetical protein [Caudoviricetes sp.]DAK71570.1 MAG TPA: hypothetical protein [Caudoviricetes sp.]